MYKAPVKRDFTFEKFKSHGVFKKGTTITNLTEEDVDYLKKAGVIGNAVEIVEEAVELVRVEEAEKTVEKAVKKKTKKK